MTTLDHAKLYLAKVLPWPQANEAPAYVNLHWTFNKDGKTFWTGRAVQSIQDAISSLTWALSLPDTRDIYACMSMQQAATEKLSQKGFKYWTPIRNQQNAVALKSLFLDIDLKGGDHGYNTDAEVQAALAQFLKDTGLPEPSLTVFSGGGYHVYWTMDRQLPPEEWKPLAHALAEATKQHGLKCDTQCTIDCARVLRIPDTLNRKQDTPRPVTIVGNPKDYDYLVDRLAKPLEPYKLLSTPSHPNTATLENPALFTARPPVVDELSTGIEQVAAAPIDVRSAARECAFIREAIMTGGKNYTNPMWMLTTLLATWMDKPKEMAHRMAKDHPGYTKESTDDLFDRKLKDRDEKSLGWPQCKTISASGCKACQTCPHFAANKSPFNFVDRIAPIVVATASPPVGAATTSDLPRGYHRLPSGVIAVPAVNEVGVTEYVPICDYKMVNPQVQKDPWVLHFTSSVERHIDTQISIPVELVGTQNMRAYLQKQAFMVPCGDKGAQNLARFLMAWIKQLQETKDSVVAAPFGWGFNKAELEGFSFGGQLWTPNAPKLAAAPDPTLAKVYAPSGEIQKWIDAAALITKQGRPALDSILAAAFAGPLVQFTGLEGIILSAYSVESGIGKSTTMKVAQAVWGHPVRAMQSLNDTVNSVTHKLGQLRSLPLFWDELKTDEHTKKFVELTFTTTQGKERSRLTRNIQQREPGSWQTLVVSASNDSLLDHVTRNTSYTEAGLLRIVELVVPPPDAATPGQIDPSEAAILVSHLNQHHGQVGLKYAQWLGANFAQVADDMKELLAERNARLKATADERFWNGTLACILLGARYANQLGVTSFDLGTLEMYLDATLGHLRAARQEAGVGLNTEINLSSIIANFLAEHRAQNTIRTNRIHVGVGKPAHGTIRVVGMDASRLQGVYVHIGVEDKLMRISNMRLSDWLKQKGHPIHSFYERLRSEYQAKRTAARLGSGIAAIATPKEYVWEIDLTNAPMLDFIDEA